MCIRDSPYDDPTVNGQWPDCGCEHKTSAKDKLHNSIGVMKAYSSCVGDGPFTAELAMTEEEKHALREAGPVSYTHLDVYKRQRPRRA